MDNHYLKHVESGEVYAVQIDRGVIASCVGPLHHRDVRDADDHDYADGVVDAVWAQGQRWTICPRLAGRRA